MATIHLLFGQVTYGDAGTILNDGDDVDVSDPEVAKYVAALESAGALTVDCTDDERKALSPHVQSQEDGEAALQEAMDSGAWHESNLELFNSGASGFGLGGAPQPADAEEDEQA